MTNDYGVCKPGSAMYKFECFALLLLGLFAAGTSLAQMCIQGFPKMDKKIEICLDKSCCFSSHQLIYFIPFLPM